MEPTPAPSRVREFILAQHDLLRLRMQGLLVGSARLRRGELEPRAVRILARELLALLKAHIGDEERMLAVALADVDAFATVRLEKIREEHRAQTRDLSAMIASLDDSVDPEALASTVEEFARRIADDIDEEERQYLTEGLLKDDLIVTGFIG